MEAIPKFLISIQMKNILYISSLIIILVSVFLDAIKIAPNNPLIKKLIVMPISFINLNYHFFIVRVTEKPNLKSGCFESIQ